MLGAVRLAYAAAIAVVAAGPAVGASGCDPGTRSLGEECLRDQDCTSGVCAQLKCAAAPPLIDAELASDVAAEAEPTVDAAKVFDASDAAPIEAAPDGPSEAAPD
jgi:hypothetical protein